MDQEIINLYDQYTHSKMDRKGFIQRLAKLTGGMAVALTVLPLLENNYASAKTIDYPDLITADITYPAQNGDMKGFLAKPKGKKKLGTVLVIHENRGLNPHIKEVAKRVANAGYIALAVDALSPFGGTPANEEEARGLFAKIDAAKNLQNFLDSLTYLRKLPEGNGKTACVGFCWGGGMANDLAVNDPQLNAAVAYYGRQAKAADVSKIKASVMLHYGGLDERINAGIPAYREALEANKIDYQIFVYDGVNHAFNNDTSPTRYNEAAAKLAWDRTLELFKKELK
ncbi:dienelactone hydrolase family protein [Pedobacter cryophilus]|uniref:Dienelactone hydrolase family protein n=1 Tax=Pedobacter cryophilus TaxID=2571271 RepID=A0A4V5NZ57_9SPHI|nr:dienelactone hydrolase family protein [Pedobacter cryophilus]TKB95149.1 dienelactone hydrolase family protein [Pedobacter cryophilus]